MADVAGAVLRVVAGICAIAEGLGENDRQASRLVTRVSAIKPSMLAIKQGTKLASSESLRQLLATVEEIQKFMDKYTRTNLLNRVRKQKAHAESIMQLGNDVRDILQTLELGVAVDAEAWAREDAADRVEEFETLLEVMDRVERSRTRDHKELMRLLEAQRDGEIQALRYGERAELKGWAEIDYEALDFEGTVMLGSGAFGRVITAKWDGTEVAVKVLMKGDLHRDVVRALRKEIRIHASLHHEFVVQLYAASTIRPNLCLVVELAKGGSLQQYLRLSSEPLAHALQTAFLYDIARGMSFLHGKGILHRDLKSANILVFSGDRLKLCDFGLSKVKTDISSRSTRGAVGSTRWMSPEEMGKQSAATELTDVYSFGVVCFEVAARAEPYKGMTTEQVVGAVVLNVNRPQIPQRSSPSPDVVPLMEQCWRHIPAERPQGFKPVVKMLKDVVERVGDPRNQSAAVVDVIPLSPLQVPDADRATLVALFRATGGDSWKRKGKWDTAAELSEWEGVEVVKVNGQSRVVELSLSCNNLQGCIPEDLGCLTSLTKLLLEDNNLMGSIPKTLGALKKLERLLLHNNQLAGSIPKELGALTELKVLDLRSNHLSGPIPPELGNLATLQSLRLDRNPLSEIPPEVLRLFRGNLGQALWEGNPWSRPPSTVLGLGYESALGWWEDLKRFSEGKSGDGKFGEGKSNKLKMVLVGQPEAGKTTIVRRFTGRSVPKRSDRTVGVEITPNWSPVREDLQVSVWDFAGQADYYASHQLFLTKGALFLLVVDLHAFSEEVHGAVGNFTDPRGRIFRWLEMIHMRVPGAAIVLVGTHVDLMEEADAVQAGDLLHEVVSAFIQAKVENASKRQSACGINTESTKAAVDGVQGLSRGSSLARQAGSSKLLAKPLVLHGHVFKVSISPSSVDELRQWIVKAAFGRECPSEFNFPAVDQTLSKAWIDAYDAMDTLKKNRPCVLWCEALEEFRNRTRNLTFDAGKVLLRAMQLREAEGGVLLSLADTSAPVATDMLHLDPAWLIELVARWADHNLVNVEKQGSLEQEIRQYAKQQGLDAGALFDMHRLFCKAGILNRAYLRFLWMHRKMNPSGAPVVLTDTEFESIILTMKRLLVMYTSRDTDNLVVPARLPEYGDQRVLDPDKGEIIKMECSFGQIYPPQGIVGRFLAWSTQHIDAYEECWQHGAFLRYSYQSAHYDVFLYESEVEEYDDDGTLSKFAGLTLGVQGSSPHAPKVLANLRDLLEQLVSDSAYGYPGVADLMYFGPLETIKPTGLRGLRSLLDNVGDLDNIADRLEKVAASLEKTARSLYGVANQPVAQALLAANADHTEYPCPRLMILVPDAGEGGTQEHLQRAGWDRWTKAWENLHVPYNLKFRLRFLCEHNLAEVPCGPDGRGYPVEQPTDFVRQCAPLMQVSMWLLRVAVGTVSNVDLPLNEVLGAVVKATGAELLKGVATQVPYTIDSGAVPMFGEGATDAEIQGFRDTQGRAYKSLCKFMREAERSPPRFRPWFIFFRRQFNPPTVSWKDSMVQVKNRDGGWAWVLKENQEAYLRGRDAPAAARPRVS